MFDDQSISVNASPELIAEKKKAWNTSLYYLNLIQFATNSHVAVSSNMDSQLPSEVVQILESDIESSLPREATPAEESIVERDEVIGLAIEKVKPVLATLKEGQVLVPTIGYELQVGTRVVAEVELVWEAQKIAVVNQDHVSQFEQECKIR